MTDQARWSETGDLVEVLSTQYSVLSTRCAASVRFCSALLAIAAMPSLTGCVQTVYSPDPLPKSRVLQTASDLQLIRVDGKALDELIAQHAGQVVLVDYWATWCLPCVENFPHTVALAKKYREQGLAAIGVSFDRLEDEPRVREFLAQKGVDFDNVISQHDSIGQKAFADFDVGPLPEYRLYDRQGKLRKKWEGALDREELEKSIQELLADKT